MNVIAWIPPAWPQARRRPAPLMTTIAELGTFAAREQNAAAPAVAAAARTSAAMPATAANGTAANSAADPN